MAVKRTIEANLLLFKQILSEASKLFDKPRHLITKSQFLVAGNSRMGDRIIYMLGGYLALREYVAPGPNSKAQVSKALSVLERILKNAKAA